MKLFYDMTFQLGEVFVTILTFTNYFYVGCPVMPLAVNVHERKFKSRKVSGLSGCQDCHCAEKFSLQKLTRHHRYIPPDLRKSPFLS